MTKSADPQSRHAVFACYAIEPQVAGREGPAFRLLSLHLHRRVPYWHWKLRTEQMPAVLDVTVTARGWCCKNNQTGQLTGQLTKGDGRAGAIISHFP